MFINPRATQRAQYPLIKEYGLNYIGLHIIIRAIYTLIKAYWARWVVKGLGFRCRYHRALIKRV